MQNLEKSSSASVDHQKVSPEIDGVVADFVEYHTNPDRNATEYEQMKAIVATDQEHQKCCQVKERNRYETVPCLDASRFPNQKLSKKKRLSAEIMEYLDTDTLLLIFNQLNPVDIYSVANVCKTFRNLVIQYRSSLPRSSAVRIDLYRSFWDQITPLTVDEALPCLTVSQLRQKLSRAYVAHNMEKIHNMAIDLRRFLPEASLVLLYIGPTGLEELKELMTILTEKNSTVIVFEISYEVRPYFPPPHDVGDVLPVLSAFLRDATHCNITLFRYYDETEDRFYADILKPPQRTQTTDYGQVLKVLKESGILEKMRNLTLKSMPCCSGPCHPDTCNSTILFCDYNFLRNSIFRTLHVQLPSSVSIRLDFIKILTKILQEFADGKSRFTRTNFFSWSFFVDKYQQQKLTKEVLSGLEELQKFAVHFKEGHHFCLQDPTGFVLCVAHSSDGIVIFRCISRREVCLRRNRKPKRYTSNSERKCKMTKAQRKKLDEHLQLKGEPTLYDW